MLSLGGHITCSSFCLARCLAPLLGSLLARRTLTASAQPIRDLSPSLSSLPRFNPEQQTILPHSNAVLATQDPTQRFSSILSSIRSQYPEAVWSRVVNLFPRRQQVAPLAIDVAVGSEGRAGVELAKRGFRVLSVNGDADVLNRTLICATANSARINLIVAAEERQLVYNGAADLVTCFHGLHLLDTRSALDEIHRILKPRGKLVVAWNDGDLKNDFIDELEGLIERHVPAYSRATQQHEPAAWAARLQQGGLFALAERTCYPNPVVLRNVATLSDCLNSQSYVREALRGPARKAFNCDVRALVERRFGEGPVLLPMVTRLFILEKVSPVTFCI